MASFALAAVGRDRPGMVAAVSRVLYERGCNVTDSSMTLLRGNFVIMLVFDSEDSADGLTAALSGACDEMGLHCSVLEVDDRPEIPSPSHILTVYGADRPGILFRTTDVLAGANVNITDLNSRLVGADEKVYALMLELEVPREADLEALERELRSVAEQVGVDLTLRPLDEDVL